MRSITRLRSISFLFLPLLLAGCQTTYYNETTYQYTIVEETVRRPDFDTVVLATVNYNKPSRRYIRPFEGKIDNMVRDHLESAGYKVLPPHIFKNAWAKAIRTTGDTYDPSTDRLNENAHHRALKIALDEVKANSNADAVIFTDIIERLITFSAGVNHIARWDGVSRKVPVQGLGDGVPMDFNWGAPVEAASLLVVVYELENYNMVFNGLGGMAATQAINLKSSEPKFGRRKNLFEKDDHIQEGIDLAFHPLINMSNWPGNKPN